MNQGFVKVAAVTPKIRVADPKYNAKIICEKLKETVDKGAKVIIFPGATRNHEAETEGGHRVAAPPRRGQALEAPREGVGPLALHRPCLLRL